MATSSWGAFRRLAAGLMRAALVVGVGIAPPAWAGDPEPEEGTPGRGGPTMRADRESEDDPRIDAATGRDARVWPPDRPFEHRHLKLDLTFPDMARSAFKAVATLRLTPAVYSQTELDLDAGPAMKFSRVTVNGNPVEFDHDGARAKLHIHLGRAWAPGEELSVEMTYAAVRAGGNGMGLTWSKDDKQTPEQDYMFHAQGEAQANHLWFPCHDFPNLRLSTEIVVTVPDPYEAVSNGKLLGVSRRAMTFPGDAGGAQVTKPMVSYHWLQEKPHAYYLVTLVISRFDVVNVGGPDSAHPGLWMPVYGPLGSAERIRTVFANTPEMIQYFEGVFGTPFPWDKYAQIICRDFAAGAMENTSATTFGSFAARGGRRKSGLDDFISHELVHQWFGDLVTCASWEHVWLNEGWATMGEALWAAKKRGERGYQTAMLRSANIERGMSRARKGPRDQGMVSAIYSDPDDRFTGPDNVYQKGGMVLHMLRQRMGDEVFFRATREYLRRHAFGTAETADLRETFESVSGQSLERFFTQWVYRPGHPELGIDYEWHADETGAGGELEIKVEQLQPIDDDNPAYAFTLPFVLKFKGEKELAVEDVTEMVPMNTRATSVRVRSEHKPDEVQVDPGLTVLSRNRIRQPLAASVRQLAPEEPVYVRFQAAAAIAELDDAEAGAALAGLIFDSDEGTGDESGLLAVAAEAAARRAGHGSAHAAR